MFGGCGHKDTERQKNLERAKKKRIADSSLAFREAGSSYDAIEIHTVHR